jgi:hypothetical protein
MLLLVSNSTVASDISVSFASYNSRGDAQSRQPLPGLGLTRKARVGVSQKGGGLATGAGSTLLASPDNTIHVWAERRRGQAAGAPARPEHVGGGLGESGLLV